MRRTFLAAWMLAVAIAAVCAAPVSAQTVIERRIAELQPCSHLKLPQKVLGGTAGLGIDRLKAVVVDRATVTVTGDDVDVSFAASLACRSRDNSAIKGDASVDLTGAAALSLVDCSVRSLSLTPTRFGGSFGEVVKGAWQPVIRPKLEAEVRALLVDACADFVAGK